MDNINYIINNCLLEREQDIYLRRLNKVKFVTLAKEYKISNSRVREIYLKTDEKVKDLLIKFKHLELNK